MRDGVEVGPVRLHPRPRIYDLETADGVPYWKIALMHLDSLASTVFQRCVYWGTHEQCHFCAIGTSLQNGRTVPVKTPALLAEVAEAAARLDGAKDVTLTTGTPNRDDRGAPYMARCAEAIRDASGLPVQVQIEPPADFAWFGALKESGVEALGLHLEVWDEDVLARVAPGKHAQGRDHYLAAWEAAVDVFGRGQVSTYFILGLGESPESVMEGCRAAIDRGVYPFVVPLRPAPGSIVADGVAALGRVRARGLRAGRAAAGRGRDDEPGRPRRLRALPGLLGAQHVRAGVRRRTGRRPGGGRGRRAVMALDVRVALSDEDVAAHHRVRHEVFVREQGIFTGDDRDGWDDGAVKVVARAGARVLGAVRLYPLDEAGLWKGDRLAVLPEGRRLRIGAPLVRFAVATAGAHGGTRMIALIQARNVAFFRHLGWSAARRRDGLPGRHPPGDDDRPRRGAARVRARRLRLGPRGRLSQAAARSSRSAIPRRAMSKAPGRRSAGRRRWPRRAWR